MSDEQFDEFTDEAPKKSNKMLFILIGVAVVAINGGVAFMMMGGDDEADAAAQAPVAAEPGAEAMPVFDPSAEPGPMVALAPFVLNLDEPERARYLRIAVGLELANDESVEAVNSRMPRIRDQYIRHLSSQTVSGLSSGEDKDRVREELLSITRNLVNPAAIRAVYFTEFIIQ